MVNLTRYNIVIILGACFGAYSYGFSYAVFGTSIGEPGFYLYFGLNRKCVYAVLIPCTGSLSPRLVGKEHRSAGTLPRALAKFG